MKKILILSCTFILCLACLCSCSLFNKSCEHTEVIDAAVAPDCTNAGLTEGKHCSKCGEVTLAQQPVAPLGHRQVLEEAKDPTCTEDGYTAEVRCTVCNKTVIEKEIIPAAHKYGEWEIISESDCYFDGMKERICSACDRVDSEVILKVEHAFEDEEGDGIFSCKHCEAVIYSGNLYQVFDIEKNWYDAYEFCESLGGHLVTITSEGEQNMVHSLVEAGACNMYWLGAVRDTDGWHWVTDEEFEYTNWQYNEPDNHTANQWFIQIFGKVDHSNVPGKWNDINSVAYNPFSYTLGLVCEWELDIVEIEHYFTDWAEVTALSCFADGVEHRLCVHCGHEETKTTPKLTHNFSFNEATGITSCEHCNAVMYEGRIYRVFKSEKAISWFDAYKACDDMGGHLVTVTSENEEIFLEKYMNYASHTASTWMGGYNDGTQWKWVTGEAFEYSQWESTQPDCSQGYEFFLHINHAYFGGWNDVNPFSTIYYYICEWERI